MNTQQPEALRLADALCNGTYLLSIERNATVFELRRLYQANQEFLEALKALEELGAFEDGMFGDHGGIPQAQAKARAAITKAQE